MNSTLALVNLKKTFFSGGQQLELFRDISYEFHQGETYAITGVSGTGKSTLLYMLAGFERPDAGTVLFDGISIANYTQKERQHFLNSMIGCMFQSAALIAELTVLENIIIKGLIARQSYDECVKNACELLERVGLTAKAHLMPATLSGGEAQRVALVRALFMKPRLLLADEPTAHLDAHNRNAIIDLMLEYQQRLGMGIVISTHDHAVAHHMRTVLTVSHGSLKAAI